MTPFCMQGALHHILYTGRAPWRALYHVLSTAVSPGGKNGGFFFFFLRDGVFLSIGLSGSELSDSLQVLLFPWPIYTQAIFNWSEVPQRIVLRGGSICFRLKPSSTVVQWLTPSPHSQQVLVLVPGRGQSVWSLFVLPLSARVPSGYFGLLRGLVCSHMQHLQIINNLILEKYLQRDKHIFWSLNLQAKFKVCLHHTTKSFGTY